MIFKSHLLTMLVYSIIVATMLAFLRFDTKKEIIRGGLKVFLMMAGGVIVFSWVMYLI